VFPGTDKSLSIKSETTHKALERINREVELDLPWYEQVLNIAATPFSYETGFYFNGKKTYHMQACGFTTILGGFMLLIIFFVLFGPVMMGHTVYSELRTQAFSTPADVPMNETIPSGLAQFFGR
jgi:ABC-type dipeptide/oligopeptide/nickel transport system permease component